MRTTLDIDDNVLAAARAIATAERRPLGAVISDLARKALGHNRREFAGFPTFDVPDDAPPLTTDMVSRALEE